MDSRGKDSPYVRETTRVAELKDNFGATRFKVALTDFKWETNDDLREFDRRFQVTVVSYCYGEEAMTIVQREFDWFDNAVKFFEQMKEQYRALVVAETKDYQDIRIYAQKTGYRAISPDCCATCKWACPITKSNSLFGDWLRNHQNRFRCMNAELYKAGTDAGAVRETFKPVDIRPEVDAMCVCNGYERRLDPAYKDPAHTERAYREHDMNPEMVVETIAKAKVTEYVEGSLDSVIIPEVGKRIDEKLNYNPPVIEGNRNLGDMTFDGGGAE